VSALDAAVFKLSAVPLPPPKSAIACTSAKRLSDRRIGGETADLPI